MTVNHSRESVLILNITRPIQMRRSYGLMRARQFGWRNYRAWSEPSESWLEPIWDWFNGEGGWPYFPT